MEYFMARRPRRNHSNDFKATVALAAIKALKSNDIQISMDGKLAQYTAHGLIM